MLRLIAKLLHVLNSETDPSQISLGFCLAMVAGFTPLLSLHNIFILLLVLVMRVNLSAFLLGLGVFSGLSYILDPLFHWNGLHILSAPSLEGVWTSLYNSTLWRLERFNNTIVMGSLGFSLILFVPVWLLSNMLIRRYRTHILSWVENTRLMQVFKASKLYQVYASLSHLGGA